MIKIIKKDGLKEDWDSSKIVSAVRKSAERVMITLTEKEETLLSKSILDKVIELNQEEVSVDTIHKLVEITLMDIGQPKVSQSYSQYRDNRKRMADIFSDVYSKVSRIRYRDDRENANMDGALVSTQTSMTAGIINSALYKEFWLSEEERRACKEGFFHIHDQPARLSTYNCCLFRANKLLEGGFTINNITYTRPKTLSVALCVLGDIILMSAGQQYGGWSCRVDSLIAPFVEETYEKYKKEYANLAEELGISKEEANTFIETNALKRIDYDLRQGFQGIEHTLNTVASSRGDYPFVTFSFGCDDSWGAQKVSEWVLKVRMNGQGPEGKKVPVIFPKLVFLHDENLHTEGKPLYWLKKLAIKCSSKAMYPDYLSMNHGYTGEMYQKYGKVVYPMGCRAFLSPWWERGGIDPADETDKPVFEGRFNLGAISLNMIMIYQEAKELGIDFYDNLLKYMRMIRKIHIRTFNFLSEKRASMSPLAFCYGGLYRGNLKPDQKLGRHVLEPCTMSFGITGLNELNRLHNGKSIYEDGEFPMEVMKYINSTIEKWKYEDKILYAIYGTPAESLSGVQVRQFRDKYGIVENVSDKDYVSNSFHCHVTEDISPIVKMDTEVKFWDLFRGGRIMYGRFTIQENEEAIEVILNRAMEKGLYYGINFCLTFCSDCGCKSLSAEECPSCGSDNMLQIDRVIGYLGATRVGKKSRMNDSKQAEIKDRRSM